MAFRRDWIPTPALAPDNPPLTVLEAACKTGSQSSRGTAYMRNIGTLSLLASSAVLVSSIATAQPAPPPADAAPDPATAGPPAAEDAAPDAAEEAPQEDLAEAPASSPPPAPSPSPEALPPIDGTAEAPRSELGEGYSEEPTATPAAAAAKAPPAVDVFAEDWWSHARPVLELHGYFRTRVEMFHQFSLARINAPAEQLWPMPLDNYYTAYQSGNPTTYGPTLCTEKGADAADGLRTCRNKTQAGANLRFRLNPEIHISDNLRIVSQIDLLDNVAMGTTPEGYALTPDAAGGYASLQRGGYNALSLFDVSQAPPTSGVNGTKDSISVKRVWAEYQTPVGELRFGRMPSHWGLGILANAGDGYDDDYQTTMDRVMFVTGIKALDLYFAAAWDFANEGATTENLLDLQGQAHDAAERDDVRQVMLSVARRAHADLQQNALAKKRLVLNGGLYLLARRQRLANDLGGNASEGAVVPGAFPESLMQPRGVSGYVRRGALLVIPDLWVQALYQGFRFEAEAVTVQGRADNVSTTTGTVPSEFDDWKFRMWGFATETELRLLEDRLSLDFKAGWASGDPEASEADLPGSGGLTPGYGDGLQRQLGDDTYSTFAFHPNYRIDLILHRNILSRVQGSYYVRPGVAYDFLRSTDGQRLGGGFGAIWSRASSYMQTPGHKRDLGIELNGKIYFQSKDGALNDRPGTMGGFYTQLEYGVLFPLGGLGYQRVERSEIQSAFGNNDAGGVKAAQTLRWYLGVLF